MRRLALLALFVPSIATAENDLEPEGRELHRQPDGYIASGMIFGSHRFEYEGVLVEGGRRIARSPLFVRALGHGGRAKLESAPGVGTYIEARAGGELRTCSATGMLCGSLGIDLGLHRTQFQHVDLMQQRKPGASLDETFSTAVIVPRFTVDGGNRVRVRGVLELPNHHRESERTKGVAVSLAIGVAF
jgi:hypothetical protein